MNTLEKFATYTALSLSLVNSGAIAFYAYNTVNTPTIREIKVLPKEDTTELKRKISSLEDQLSRNDYPRDKSTYGFRNPQY